MVKSDYGSFELVNSFSRLLNSFMVKYSTILKEQIRSFSRLLNSFMVKFPPLPPLGFKPLIKFFYGKI